MVIKKLKISKGFTLIELLVVVAIIGILAAVGVVAYNGYTASAKEKVCVNNFKLWSKLIKEKYTLCQLQETIELQAQYWKNTPGAKSNFNCSGIISLSSMIGPVSKHITNFMRDPYNPDFHGNVEMVSWNWVPYKDGMIAYYGNRIRSRCRGIQYEEIFE